MHFERIDQLRGLAALAVVICHASGSAYLAAPNVDTPVPWFVPLVLGFGYLGVPLFFVISGLCIHLPQARSLAAQGSVRVSWRSFFLRRFWRLYPAYLATLVIAVVLMLIATGGLPVSWKGLLAQALLVHTLHPATFDGVNPPVWTLAVEAQLYLAYPILLWLFVRFGAWRGLAAVLAITMTYRGLLNFDPTPPGFGGVAWELFLARWFEWALGATIAAWAVGAIEVPRAVRSPLLAAVVLAAGIAFEWHTWRPGFYTFKEPLYGVAFALVVIVALDGERQRRLAGQTRIAAPGGGLSAARGVHGAEMGLRAKLGAWLAGVGVYSYSVYLLHRPIQMALEPVARWLAATPFVLEHRIPSSLILMLAATPVILWSARLCYRWCEGPSVAIAQRIGRTSGRPAPATHEPLRDTA